MNPALFDSHSLRRNPLAATVAFERTRYRFDILTDYVVFASSIFYALAVIAVMILRRTRPDLPRPVPRPR